MENTVVRLVEIELENFKNVRRGEIGFVNKSKNYDASILGLYGQNGSGKTALIDALSVLKYALCGAPIPGKYADYINVDADAAHIEYSFTVTDSDTEEVYGVTYEIVLRKSDDTDLGNVKGGFDGDDAETKLLVASERLSVALPTGKRTMQAILDTAAGDPFGPKTKYNLLTGGSSEGAVDLLVAKKLSALSSRSFAFSRECVNVIHTHCKEAGYRYVYEALVEYGNFGLFVIDTSTAGLISLNALPLIFRHEGARNGRAEVVSVPISDGAVVPEDFIDNIIGVIDNMNVVLSEIVPGLKIALRKIGTRLTKEGEVGWHIQLMSQKNNKEIPIQYESDGIKKIIAILQMLIVVYNKSSITVAIDELDAGVFEYLLGELLRIISERGRGQLIFTSHNLRPLETLDKGFVAFTTTNPDRRYMRFSGVKTNNNLRDFYYRDIVLGEQSEEIYQRTKNSEIALAFREAGEAYGTT